MTLLRMANGHQLKILEVKFINIVIKLNCPQSQFDISLLVWFHEIFCRLLKFILKDDNCRNLISQDLLRDQVSRILHIPGTHFKKIIFDFFSH